MFLLSAVAITNIYYIFFALVYGCIAAICFLALFFGRRARRNVKKEKVTHLPDGLSPLDVQRIFIGKTYPQRLTRALLAHWARYGYIKLKYVSKYTVRVIKLKSMPAHMTDKAVFYDRGTYVRERTLFESLMRSDYVKTGKPVDLRRSMFGYKSIDYMRDKYAVREDEGVYSKKHYSLKILTLVLSILPFAFCAIWAGVDTGMYMGLILVGTAIIGLFVFMFVLEMPILFKLIWCGMWLGASVGGMIAIFGDVYDPFGIVYAAIAILFVGSLGLIRFVDYREKNNLSDYSDLINYRKFLLHAPASELNKLDYAEVLPFLYAFNIKPFVKNKFIRELPSAMYEDDPDRKGALL